MNKKSLYTVMFYDETVYEGGSDFFEPNWQKIPLFKPIKRIFCLLPSGDYLTIGPYEKYFFLIEGLTDVGMVKGQIKQGTTVPVMIKVMGKVKNKIIVYEISLKTGQLTYKIYNESDKFVKGLNQNSWRG